MIWSWNTYNNKFSSFPNHEKLLETIFGECPKIGQVNLWCLLQHNVSCGRSQNLQAYEWLYSDTTFFLNNILKVSLVGEGTIRFCQIKTNITIRPSGVSTMKLEKTCLKKFPEKANYETFSQRYLQNGCKSQYLTNAALGHQQHVCIINEKH